MSSEQRQAGHESKEKMLQKHPYVKPSAAFIRTDLEERMATSCKPGGAFCLKGNIG